MKSNKIEEKIMIKLLLVVTAILVPFASANAGEMCFSAKAIHHENLFSHCKKGDIIQVSAIVAQVFSSYDETARGLMHIDGVSDYCSFDHPIVEIGITKLKGKDPIKVFSCVYTGEQRSSNLKPVAPQQNP